MPKIAVIDKQPSSVDYSKYFQFEFDLYHMSSKRLTKLLKKDVDVVIDESAYDFIILIGSEAAKFFAKITSVSDKAGHLVNDKYIPLINPAMLIFKPEAKDSFEKSVETMHRYISGEEVVNLKGEFYGITDEQQAREYLQRIADDPTKTHIALDTETTALYPRDGYVLGISISADVRCGAYIDSSCISDDILNLFQYLIDTREVIFHNAKFDLKMLEYHFSLKFEHRVEHLHDTLLEHYTLDETQGSHGLKQLAIKYTSYGDYDKQLDEFKKTYCREHKIKEDDFTYDLIPFEILSTYAAIDTAATIELHHMFYPLIAKNAKLLSVYRNILVPGMLVLKDIEEYGIPMSLDRLKFAGSVLDTKITAAYKALYEFPEIKKLEEDQGSVFNPNSVQQLRKLLFDYIGLSPTGKLTGTGADSTDAEVLEELSSQHPIVSSILSIRKLTKIKGTYIDKILVGLDRDSKLRTFFNITSTTSGRLSSSGKFNAQQIPRDDPIVKGCIVAKPGYKIVSQD